MMKPFAKISLALFGLMFGQAIAEGPAEKGNIYSPIGKRDPFKPPPMDSLGRDLAALNPLERFSVEQLQLRAILRGMGKPRAMFEDPEGKTYVVIPGMIVGRERATISRILGTSVVMTQRTFDYLGQESLYEKVVSLPASIIDQGIDEGASRAGNGNRNVASPLTGGGDFGGSRPPASTSSDVGGGGATRNVTSALAPQLPAQPSPATPSALPPPASGPNIGPVGGPAGGAEQTGGNPVAAPETIMNKGNGGLTY